MRLTSKTAQSLIDMAASFFVILAVASQVAAQTWTQLTPTGTPPSPRGFHGVTTVYDPGSNRMIMFAGRTVANNNNDVWVLTNANGLGGTSQWINLIPNNAAGAPPLRSGHSAVYDPATNRMIIFAGCNGYCLPVLNDVWVLTNANGLGGTPAWIQLSPTGGGPAPRATPRAVYDQVNNRMIVFAGQNGLGGGASFIYTDVWVLSNANGVGGPTAWTQLAPAAGPLGGYGASAIYDSVGNRMTVFGGAAQTIGGIDAVWTLSNANGLGGIPVWTNLITEAAPGSPSNRGGHSAVYDPTGNQMMVFGGGNSAGVINEVWRLANANGLGGTPTWAQFMPTSGLPPGREFHGAVFDTVSKRMTIFGGDPGNQATTWFNDTWVLALTPREIHVVSASAAPGSSVTIPIELISQGDENALGFSLTYNPAILSNPQVALGVDANTASLNLNNGQTAQGRLGIAVALPATKKFDAGTRQVVNITFTIAANAQATTTQIGFGDQQISREVVAADASILPATYLAGVVTVTPGYEADVSPRPNGNNNGTVTIADWVQVGRFAAGVDTAAAGSEFQRADCAPKDTKGDGRTSIADWVQAGRYAAGVDAVVAAGGPTAPVGSLRSADCELGHDGCAPLALDASANPPTAIRTLQSDVVTAARLVRAIGTSIEPGRRGSVAIEIDAMGDENALGFSLNFDAAQLQFVSAALGSGASGASLNLNTAQAVNGRVGIGLALPTNQTFVAGKRQLIVITFAANANASAVETTVTLGDLPVEREIVDAAANALTATWSAAVVTLARPVASVSAASFKGELLASEAIVAAFGSNLSSATQIATTVPLPTSLAGTSVKVKDAAGVERLASLFFVAPTQVNYLVPAGTAAGDAVVTITSSDGVVSGGKVRIAAVAPGLFSADASGQGIAAATVLRIKADGSQRYEPVGHFDSVLNRFVASPIDLGAASDQVFLILFGTGLRHRSSLAAATPLIGGSPVEVLYVGEQGGFVGLDQVNLRLPRSLAGRGEVEIALSLDAAAANVVRISIK